MTNPRVLVIIGHPLPGSLCQSLARAYLAGLGDSVQTRVIDLAIAPIPEHPTRRDQLRAGSGVVLPEEVAKYAELIEWADHLAVFYPQWWGTYPAALKAFIDRVFVSGRAYRQQPNGLPIPLWGPRTARFVMTMDSPRFWNRLVYFNASENSLTRATFGYVGIKTVGFTRLSPVRSSTAERRASWLEQATALGRRDAAKVRPLNRTAVTLS